MTCRRIALISVAGIALALALSWAGCAGPDPWIDRNTLEPIQKGSPDRPSTKPDQTDPDAGTGKTAPVEIGLLLPLSGPTARLGKMVRDGVNLAMSGTDPGPIRLVVLDSKGTVPGTRAAFENLANRASVIAVIGPVRSKTALAAAAMADETGLPLILPSATNFDATRNRSHVFRICFSDPLEGAALSIFSRRHLRLASVGVVEVAGDLYSRGLSRAYRSGFTGLGGEIAFRYVMEDTRDPAPALKALAALPRAPEAIFLPLLLDESLAFMRGARKQGYAGLFLGGDGWHLPHLLEQATSDVKGAYFVTHYLPDDPRKAAARFSSTFASVFGRQAGPLEALGHDSAAIVLEALSTLATPTRNGLKEKLEQVAGFRGATGRIWMEESGNPLKTAVIARITEQGPRFEDRISFRPGVR